MPSGESMITTLRNNKSQRLSKDRKARNTLSVKAGEKDAFSFDKQTATSADLFEIRHRIEQKEKRSQIRFTVVFVILAAVVFFVILRVFGYFFQ